jgi:ankyrin repeat protein
MPKITISQFLLTLSFVKSFFSMAMEPELYRAQQVIRKINREEANTALFDALHLGILSFVKRALEAGADVNARDAKGWSPLHCAANWGRLEIVRELIARGADVNAGNKAGFTPLHLASERGHHAVVRELLMQGAFTEVGDSLNNYTPLRCAILDGRKEVMRELLRFGAQLPTWIAAQNQLFTPFEVCILYGDPAGLKSLEEHLIDIGYPLTGEELERALTLAVGQGNARSVDYLLRTHNALDLSPALAAVTAILWRFERLRQSAQSQKAVETLDQGAQPYRIIHALMVARQLLQHYRAGQSMATLLDFLPRELFTLVLSFFTGFSSL